MLHGWNKLFVRGVPLKFQHAPLIWQSAFQRTWKEIAWKKRLVVPFVTTMQRLYAFHVWFWLQTIFSCKVKSPSLALSVALSWNWGDLTGVPGVSTDSIIKAITSKHSKHKWDFTTATWAKEQGHQVGYNSIPFWKVHHFALWNHHSTVSAPTMCYPVSIQQAHFRQILCWWQREPVFHIASGMGSWDQWIHFREGYVPPNTWQDSLHWGREFFVPSFVLKQLSWFLPGWVHDV